MQILLCTAACLYSKKLSVLDVRRSGKLDMISEIHFSSGD